MKTDIVLIHGFRGTHHGLARIAAELGDEYQLHIPDLPGFGEGPQLANYGLTDYTTWLGAYLKSLTLDRPPILLGHSFGSIITAAYAAEHPEAIKKLILVNPIGAPALEGPKAVLTQLAIFYYWLGRTLPAKLAQPWLSAKSIVMVMSITMAKTKDAALRRYIHDQHLTYFSRFHNPDSLSQAFQTSVKNTVRDAAPRITTPTLLIAGDKDDITPIEKQRLLQPLFLDAQLVIIEGVGHLTHYETPEQVAAYIQGFITES